MKMLIFNTYLDKEEQLKKLQESIARIAKRCNECLECHHFSNGCDGNSKPCEAFEPETYKT